jgi:hypothetical protein
MHELAHAAGLNMRFYAPKAVDNSEHYEAAVASHPAFIEAASDAASENQMEASEVLQG